MNFQNTIFILLFFLGLLSCTIKIKVSTEKDNLSDERGVKIIVENTEDTVTLLNKYIDDLPIDLSKDRLKNQMKSLYTEAQDLDLE